MILTISFNTVVTWMGSFSKNAEYQRPDLGYDRNSYVVPVLHQFYIASNEILTNPKYSAEVLKSHGWGSYRTVKEWKTLVDSLNRTSICSDRLRLLWAVLIARKDR